MLFGMGIRKGFEARRRGCHHYGICAANSVQRGEEIEAGIETRRCDGSVEVNVQPLRLSESVTDRKATKTTD
jgi:hypothetical protein